MFERTFVGNTYRVYVFMEVKSYEGYYDGDHYASGHFFSIYYGSGEVTVYDLTSGKIVAICGLHTKRDDVSEEMFSQCVEAKDLLPERQKPYADWFAEKWIRYFLEPQEEDGKPNVLLTKLDRTELIRCGFVPDPNGQISLLLHDACILNKP